MLQKRIQLTLITSLIAITTIFSTNSLIVQAQEQTDLIKDKTTISTLIELTSSNTNFLDMTTMITEKCTKTVLSLGGVTQDCATFIKDFNNALKPVVQKYQSLIFN